MENIHNLPDIILKIIRHARDAYSPGHADYTPSSLIRPPKQTVLLRKHGHEVEQDASSMLASLLGTCWHDFAEKAVEDDPDYIVEKRFYRDYKGVVIGGQIDLYHKPDKMLYDYKVTSIFKALKGADDEWILQNSINKWIMEENSIPVKGSANIIYSKDWRRGESAKNPDYPNTPIVVIPIPLLKSSEVEAFLDKRLNEIAEGDNVRDCTPEERWADDPKFAVMKFGRKRASKLCDTREEAEEYIAKQDGGDFFIEERFGDAWRRCRDYCPVAAFCDQYKEGVINES